MNWSSQVVDLATLGAFFSQFQADMQTPAFWLAVGKIIWINVLLSGDNAIAKYRDVMGATDPSKAADGTIRKVHAKSIGENSVHGSDAPETAAIEIAQFFSGNEIVG